jgi:hypothetical protein
MTAKTDLAKAKILSEQLDKVNTALDILNSGGSVVGLSISGPSQNALLLRQIVLELPGFTSAVITTRLTAYQTSLQTQLTALGVT